MDDIIYGGSKKGVVYIWDHLKNKSMILEAHKGKINSIQTDQKRIFTSSIDFNIRVWNRISGNFVFQLKHFSSVKCFALIDSKDFLVTGASKKNF